MNIRWSIVFIVCFLSGCSLFNKVTPPERSAQELYTSATKAMAEKNYKQAAEDYGKLKDNYPFSPNAIEAERRLGDALFFDEKYAEAAEAYKEFETLHPRHEEIPYILYQIGMSSLEPFVSIDRSALDIEEAYTYFKRVQEQFPNSLYTQKAIEAMVKCRLILAEHQLYFADVFWSMGKYGSSWRRYSYVVDSFPDVDKSVSYAQEKGLASYFLYRKESSIQAREEVYGVWKNIFKWL